MNAIQHRKENDEMEKSSEILVKVNVINANEAIEKAEKLVSLLKEAKSLADELATVDMKLLSEINVQS